MRLYLRIADMVWAVTLTLARVIGVEDSVPLMLMRVGYGSR